MGPGAGLTGTPLGTACSQPAWAKGWGRCCHLAAEPDSSEEGHGAHSGWGWGLCRDRPASRTPSPLLLPSCSLTQIPASAGPGDSPSVERRGKATPRRFHFHWRNSRGRCSDLPVTIGMECPLWARHRVVQGVQRDVSHRPNPVQEAGSGVWL